MAMANCRGLIEFCRAYEQHRNNQNKSKKIIKPLMFCNRSPSAFIEIFVSLIVLTALGVLLSPYFTCMYSKSTKIFWEFLHFISKALFTIHAVYAISLLLILLNLFILWRYMGCQWRKCGNPFCKGLKKSVEFDIQLESEDCLKSRLPMPSDTFGAKPLELGEGHKELEAELRRIAPPNGRTVLIFRDPCGCPIGRLEVWGPKKVRRINK